MTLPEEFLHYVWQHRLFGANLTTVGGEPIEVINTGVFNTNAGPDFFNAQIRIGQTLWAGNIEIHTTSAEWYAHGHHTDSAYDNVILHVVGETDGQEAVTSNGRRIPECQLRYPAYIAERYEELKARPTVLRCADDLCSIAEVKRHAWIERMLTERFEELEQRVKTYLDESRGDWDQAFFCLLARAMGANTNSEAMEMLARHTPVRILMKHPTALQAEALLMGQAGLLEKVETPDEYTTLLRREYNFLRAKFSLTPLDARIWKHLRLRPQNFPEVRIAQLAAIVGATPGNFESAFRTLDAEQIDKRLSVCASTYWDNHYILGRESGHNTPKQLGLSQRRLMLINAVVPFVFSYARRYDDERTQANTIKFMQFLKPEKNSVLRVWADAGMAPRDEGEAQALLHLTKHYCTPNKCFACLFGHEVLTRKE